MDHIPDIKAALKAEIESAAETLGIRPSTLGGRAGQGGKFYFRLCDDRVRIWPETAAKVREQISRMLSEKAS
jgi:hypothetical protein